MDLPGHRLPDWRPTAREDSVQADHEAGCLRIWPTSAREINGSLGVHILKPRVEEPVPGSLSQAGRGSAAVVPGPEDQHLARSRSR